jgi:hypothetical protein
MTLHTNFRLEQHNPLLSITTKAFAVNFSFTQIQPAKCRLSAAAKYSASLLFSSESYKGYEKMKRALLRHGISVLLGARFPMLMSPLSTQLSKRRRMRMRNQIPKINCQPFSMMQSLCIAATLKTLDSRIIKSLPWMRMKMRFSSSFERTHCKSYMIFYGKSFLFHGVFSLSQKSFFTTRSLIPMLEARYADHKLTSKIATRLPEVMFDDLIRHTQLAMEEYMVFYHTLTSHKCPKSGKEHSYYSAHRCFRCDTQICKVSPTSMRPFLTPNLAVSTVAPVSAQKLIHRKSMDKIKPR